MKVWRSDNDRPAPTEVEIKDEAGFRDVQRGLGYGVKDSDGKPVFSNTHFASLEEAWERHLNNYDAMMDLVTGALERTRKELAKREAEVVEVSIARYRAVCAFTEYSALRRLQKAADEAERVLSAVDADADEPPVDMLVGAFVDDVESGP
jgi:hypothetical protein